jgi:D-alanyl-D-alanine carboxypeptidase
MKILGTSSYTVPVTNKTEETRPFETMTYLLQNKIVTKYYFKQVVAGYPSFIPTLGASIACVAEGNGMKLICVLMGATRTYLENGWSVDSYGNFDEMLELLKFSFEKYKVSQVIYENQSLYQFDVANGECDVVGTPHVNISSVLPNESFMKYLQLKVDTGGTLSAPVNKDDKIATAALYYRDVCLMEAELFAMNNVKLASDSPVVTNDVAAEKKDSGGFMSVVGIVCVVILGGFGVYLAVNNFRRMQAKKTARRRRANRRRSY